MGPTVARPAPGRLDEIRDQMEQEPVGTIYISVHETVIKDAEGWRVLSADEGNHFPSMNVASAASYTEIGGHWTVM